LGARPPVRIPPHTRNAMASLEKLVVSLNCW
jgi:hypothetical protein